MPFYEYECPHCGYRDEVLPKISDKPLTKCPSCGKTGLKKLMSAPVFRLKGSGWYETDFKGDKENKRNLAGVDEPPKAETKADSKTDTKTDAKPDSKPDSKPEAPKETLAKPAPVKTPPARKAKSRSKPARKRR